MMNVTGVNSTAAIATWAAYGPTERTNQPSVLREYEEVSAEIDPRCVNTMEMSRPQMPMTISNAP